MKTIRIINWIFLALNICFILAIPVMGIGSAAINWSGICYGFTDSQWACPWWKFAQNEMFWASFLFVPLLVMALGAWLVMNIIQRTIRAYRRKNPLRPK